MSMSPTPSPHEFVGWARRGPGKRWYALCSGYSAEVVLAGVLALSSPGGDRAILAAGVDPNIMSQPFKRRRF